MSDTPYDLTPERALELLRQARDLKGSDYVYRPEQMVNDVYGPRYREGTCSYFEDDGSPSCMVGHVFHWAGVPRKEIEEGSTATTVARHLGLPDPVTHILAAAQYAQDDGETWGLAFKVAVRAARRRGVNVDA